MPEVDLVAVTPYGRQAGSSRVRVYDWLDHFGYLNYSVNSYINTADAGTRTLITQPAKVLQAEAALRTLARRPTNRLLLHREASPFSRGRLEARLLRNAALSVYDFDDALQWDLPRSIGTRVFPKPVKCLASVCNADRVVAGNELLADWASAYTKDVRIIPSCVDPSRYLRKVNYELRDPPQLMWIGSPATEKYILPIADALRALHERTGARLTVISRGSQPLSGLDHMVDRQDWDSRGFAAQLTEADVGIGSLDNTKYATGKCAYKVLQYAAVGLPSVVSPVGANLLAASRFKYAVATTDVDWLESLEALLYSSSGTRSAIGAAARGAVEKHYSFDAWSDEWMAAYDLPRAT